MWFCDKVFYAWVAVVASFLGCPLGLNSHGDVLMLTVTAEGIVGF